jgi:carbon starvation protein
VILTAALMSIAWGYLVYGGSISTIWPLFGIANQLLGTMALAIGTTFLIHHGKLKYIWTTVIPMVFLAVTTIAAGIQSILNSYLPAGQFLLSIIAIIIIIMVVAILIDSLLKWYRMIFQPTPAQPLLN